MSLLNTGLFRHSAEEAVAGPLAHLFRVEAHPAGLSPFELDAEDLEVTMSEDWAPFAQARITAVLPTAKAYRDMLDPRTNCRVRIYAGYRYQDTTQEVPLLADLGLRSRPLRLPAGTMDLAAASDEARAQDALQLNALQLNPADIAAAVRYLADRALAPGSITVQSEYAAGTGKDALAGFAGAPGDSYWSLITDAAALVSSNVRVWCDETRIWRITGAPLMSREPVHMLTVGENGTIIDADDNLDREEWYNSVLLRYRWKDADNADRTMTGRASITSGKYSVNSAGQKTYFEEIPRSMTADGAANRATKMLRILSSRGRSLTLQAAAAYWVRPADIVGVQLPDGPAEKHIVQSVAFRPGDGTMRITLRQPYDAVTTIGA